MMRRRLTFVLFLRKKGFKENCTQIVRVFTPQIVRVMKIDLYGNQRMDAMPKSS